MSIDLRSRIATALHTFNTSNFSTSCIELLDALGYRSGRRLALSPNTAANFESTFAGTRTLNREQARVDEWTEANFLLQLTDDEVVQTEQLHLLREHDGWNSGIYRSFAFLAIGLAGERYSRTALAAITRAVNRVFTMPTPIFFRYDDKLTLAIIMRRPGKRDASQDVLDKVTLIKDIDLRHPHAAHIRILEDLALANLRQGQSVGNFDDLQNAWAKTLDISELNKRFYQELANWYYWAVNTVTFPRGDSQEDAEVRNAVAVIRLITRLIFVWFIKEKGLVPDNLFERNQIATVLHDLSDSGGSYYKAILQNLFFATLNTEMNTPTQPRNRLFRSAAERSGFNRHYRVHSFYRYAALFQIDEARAQALFATIPFLNGGLFECLDRPDQGIRIDGFSDRADNLLHVPNMLFFGDARPLDLNEIFGTRNKQYQVRGIFEIFHHYKFTIEENTPIDEEVALDPELLGQVFENLLAAYNPETRTTARKQTGSFYTPREIVDYMVDEAEIACLADTLRRHAALTAEPDSYLAARLRHLFAYTDEPHQFTADETVALIEAIDRIKILDPACGSGAFPMGVLHKLVFILRKLDPNNKRWKQQQLARVQRDRLLAEQMEDEKNREHTLKEIDERAHDIERSFAEQNHELDYTRKLYLIENCIYGVDIQPIAVQIAKLRFFISLVADQRVDDAKPNRGVRALPNLETKFVAANTLIGIARPKTKPPATRQPVVQEVKQCVDELLAAFTQYRKVTSEPLKQKWLGIGREICDELNALLAHDASFTPLSADWIFPATRDTQTLRVRLPGDDLETAAYTTMTMRNPEIETLEGELRRVRQRHFTARTAQTKKKYREEDERLREQLGVLLERDGLPRATSALLSGWNPYDQNAHADFFDPEWMFGVTEGFDITIGNPPYVRADAGEKHLALRKRLEASGQYETLWEKWDLYIPFIELGYKLLRPGGVTTMIVSDAYCHSKYAQKSQNWFLENSRVLRLDFFSKIKIFDAAVHNITYFFQRADGKGNLPERRVHDPEFGMVKSLTTAPQSQLNYRTFFPADMAVSEVQVLTIPLHEICYMTVGMVVHADEKIDQGAFELQDLVSDSQDSVHTKPFVEGKHLGKWSVNRHRWLEWNTYRAPSMFRRPTFPELYLMNEKLLAARMSGSQVRVCYDSKNLLCNHTAIVFVPWKDLEGVRNRSIKKVARYHDEKPQRADMPDRYLLEQTSRRFVIKYILALMNSSHSNHLLQSLRRSNTDLYPDDWKSLPIPDVSLAQQQPLVKLVEQILAAKTQNLTADVSGLEAEIDLLVYDLYGLTEKEIQIVEGNR